MSTEPNFGPYSSWPSVRSFTEVSQKAYKVYHEAVSSEDVVQFSPTQHLWLRMLYLAETTSFSIRLLTSWALALPALALARTRLEQTIVCSYLVHEDQLLGLEPFVKHIPVLDYLNTHAAASDPGIAARLDQVDLSGIQAEAIAAQESITPGFDIEHDKLHRKWTKLDLRAMTKRRDELTANQSPLSKDSLELYYVSLYKTASSIVHSDCSALSHRYLNLFSAGLDGPAVLMPLPSWSTMVVAFTSHFDIIQVFEVLSRLGFNRESELMELRDIMKAAIGEYLE